MNTFGDHLWQVTLPDDWVAEQETESALLYHPDGPGTLQISALAQSDTVTAADLRAIAAEHLDAGAQTDAVELGSFSGFSLSYAVADEFWREWYLRGGSTLLFATYNCDLDDEGKEDDIVELILGTLRTDTA
jgi:hypothetical protein